MKIKKTEAVFFLTLLLIAAISWLVLSHLRSRKDYGSVTISVNGADFGTFDLGKDQVIEIPTTDLYGESHLNVCTIHDGTAVMTDADCPDKLCMYMPPVDENGGYICCLPHGIFVMGNPSKAARDGGQAIDSIGG